MNWAFHEKQFVNIKYFRNAIIDYFFKTGKSLEDWMNSEIKLLLKTNVFFQIKI